MEIVVDFEDERCQGRRGEEDFLVVGDLAKVTDRVVC